MNGADDRVLEELRRLRNKLDRAAEERTRLHSELSQAIMKAFEVQGENAQLSAAVLERQSKIRAKIMGATANITEMESMIFRISQAA